MINPIEKIGTAYNIKTDKKNVFVIIDDMDIEETVLEIIRFTVVTYVDTSHNINERYLTKIIDKQIPYHVRVFFR